MNPRLQLRRVACVCASAVAFAGVSASPALAERMTSGGGPVMPSVNLHLVLWQPAHSGLRFATDYVNLVTGFVANVAAASGSADNVFGMLGQYGTPYRMTYAGAVFDGDRLPRSNCSNPTRRQGGSGWRACLKEGSLKRELATVIKSHGLPTGLGDVYLLVTPRGLGDCQGPGPGNCAVGGYQNNGYCGYHDAFGRPKVLFAVIPFVALGGHCDSYAPRPNRSAADPVLSVIAHELSETITDPLGTAWGDAHGNEVADVCAGIYGRPAGGRGIDAYNQVINGGHYELQELWSNATHHCEQRAPTARLQPTVPPAATVGVPVAVNVTGTVALRTLTAYSWNFGDGLPAVAGAAPTHSYAAPGSYQVTVTATDSWGDTQSATRTIAVSP